MSDLDLSELGLGLAVALAGGVGAAARFLVDAAVRARWTVVTAGGRVWPVGILVVNLTGSLALGLLAGRAADGSDHLAVIAGTGFLGGYTTFSTASVDAVLLAREGGRRAALGYLVATVAGCVALAAAGLAWSLRA